VRTVNLSSGLSLLHRPAPFSFLIALAFAAAFCLPVSVPASQSAPAAKAPGETTDWVYVNQGPAKSTEIGNFYFKRRNYKAAISRFQEAADTDPHYAPAYLGLGKAYEKLDLDQKALESYRKYLDMLPSDKDAENAKDAQRAIQRLSGVSAGR
jgi:tetratricopeptide (TPR) repeat protein